jgi:hypothetical protein
MFLLALLPAAPPAVPPVAVVTAVPVVTAIAVLLVLAAVLVVPGSPDHWQTKAHVLPLLEFRRISRR